MKRLLKVIDATFWVVAAVLFAWFVSASLCMLFGLMFHIEPMMSLGGVLYTTAGGGWVSPYIGLEGHMQVIQPWIDLVMGRLQW